MKYRLTENLLLLLCLWLLSPGTYGFASTSGSEPASAQLTTVTLSETERRWIQEHPVIRLGVDPAWPPFDFIDGQGAHSGMAADFLDLLGQRLGLTFELASGLDWDQVLQGARDRSLDLVSLSQETPARSEYLRFSDTVTSVPWVVISRRDFKKISGLEDLSAHRVAVVRNYAIVDLVRNTLPGTEIQEMDSSLDALRAVASGQVDAMVENLAVASYLISENNLVNLTVATDSGFDMMQLAFGVRSDWPELLGLLNKAIGSLSRDEIQAIKNRWGVQLAAPSPSAQTGTLKLTADEIAWIEQHPVIRAHNETGYAPFNFSVDGEPRGYAVDYIKLLASEAGLEVEFVGGRSWKQFMDMIRVDALDVLINVTPSPERKQFMHFTDQYVHSPSVVIISDQGPRIESLPDLRGKRVAITEGYFQQGYMEREIPEAELILTDSNLDALFAVLDGRADAMLGSFNAVNYQMEEHSLTGLQVAFLTNIPELTMTNALGVRLSAPLLRDILQKAMASVDEAKINALRKKWRLGSDQQASANLNAVWWLVGGVVSLFLLLMLLSIISRRFTAGEGAVLQTGTLRFRILIYGFLSVFVVLILSVGWFALERIHEQVLRGVNRNLENALVTAADRLTIWVQLRAGMLKQISMDSVLIRQTEDLLAVAATPRSLLKSAELENIRRTLAKSQSDMGLGFFVIDRDGISVASARDSNIGTRNLIAIQRPQLLDRVFAGEAVFIPPIYSDVTIGGRRIENTTSLFIAVPIRGNSGDVIAALTMRLDPAEGFSRVLQLSGVGESVESYVFDQTGLLMSSSRFESELRDIGLLSEGESSILNIQVRDPGGDMTEGFRSDLPRAQQPLTLMAESAIAASAGAGSRRSPVQIDLEGYRDYRGVPVFGAWMWDGELGLGLTSEVDVAEAMSTFTIVRLTAMGVFGVTLLLALGGIVFVLVMGERTNKALLRARDELEDRVETRTKDLRKANKQTEMILENATNGILTIDDNQVVVGFNPAAEAIWGYKAIEVLGNPITMLLPEYARKDHLKNVHRFRDSGISSRQLESRGMTLSGLTKDGTVFPAEVGISKNNIDGEMYYSAFIIDVTEQKKAEAEILEAKRAADGANQAKSAFLANMSHELRTPMNAILGYSEMLIEEAEDVGQDDFIPDLKKINQAGTHLLSLINDVLDLSKIESGKMEAYAEVFDVGGLIDQVAGTAQPLMSSNDNRFKIERGEQLGHAHQDITKLRQSLLNLLSNAAKFTHEGTITLSVAREQADGVEWLSFAVNDSGIGIAADKLDHVFEEFSQADNSTTRDYGGTGLGLAISRRFCQMLGGDLTVASQVGVGSTFTIRLPANLPGAEVPSEAASQITNEGVHASGDLDKVKPGNTILVIDDDAEASELIGRFLEKDGFTVVTALSGEEGLRLAHQLQPAAITLDVMMPDMDGWSVLRALKADPVLHTVPVVMLTMVDDKSKGYALGATDYLTKPVEHDRLHNTLARYQTPGESDSVLLVEDDVPTREMMVRTLEKAGWQVSEAGNGREALDQLDRQKPNLILLDLMMPVMDGFDFLIEMRANAEWQDIPVIVLTAKDLTDEDRRILSGRVEQIVEKGASSREHLMALIRRLVRQGGKSLSTNVR
ncbi:response regulator [Pseudomonadota bacterium]